MDSLYDNKQAVTDAVQAGRHRAIVGGLWEEIGNLQFGFLKTQGLKPHHKLLDIGCGSLRAGIKLIPYLEPGNYYGIDSNAALLSAGYDIELRRLGLQARMPKDHLLCCEDFNFASMNCTFDFALAQSVFTHLNFNRIRECLARLVEVMDVGGVFYATFFEAPRAHDWRKTILHDPGGVTTYSSKDPFHYRLDDLYYAIQGMPWTLSYLGDWRHPRDQRMVVFIRDGLESS